MKRKIQVNQTIRIASMWLILLLTLNSSYSFAQQINLSTTSSFLNNNGSGNVIFNFQNTNFYPVKIVNIAGVVGTAGTNTCNVYYKTTPVSGAPGTIDAANGWILAMTGNFTGVANSTTTVTQPFITGGSLIIPPNTTYALSIFATGQRYSTIAAGTTTISAGGCNMITGTNIGYGGGTPPAGPTLTPRGWIGTITFEPVIKAPFDIGVTAIDSPTTFCGNNRNVIARVNNFGTNQITSFNVNWSINGTPQTPISSTQNIDTVGGTGPNSVQVLLGNANFPSNVPTLITAWTSLPNLNVDTIRVNDSTSSIKQPALSGVYTIGGVGANYATINDAVTTLNTVGVCGPTVFNVNAAAGPYTSNLSFASILGSSAINTITFNGNGATITSLISPIISFNNVSYITIDSFNIVGATGFTGTGVHVTNQCRYLTFDANIINVGTTSTSTTNIGFAASGSPTGATTAGNNAQYITFTKNTVIGGYYGATFIGNTGYASNFGHHIANNTFTDFYLYGVYFLHADSSVFVSNDINRATRTSLSTLYGIYLGNSRFVKIQKNKLHDFGAASYSAYPIYIVNNVNSIGYETEISNNTIYNVGQTTGIFYGIYSLTTALSNVNIYHNTIAYDVPVASTGAIRGMFFGVAPTDVKVRNNIINITGGGSGVKTGIYLTTTSTSFISNNNNIVVATSSNNNVGFWTLTRVSLADWQTASGQDLNSNDLPPQFTNVAVGNLKPISVPLDNLGFAVGINSDIDNVSRSISTPDIGAYEFSTALVCSGIPEAGNSTSSRSYACTNQNFTLSIDSASTGAGLTYQWLVSTNGINGPYTPISNDTLRTINRTQSATSWYRCIVVCNGTGRDTSNAVNVRTTTTPFNGVYTLNKNGVQTATNYLNFETLLEELNCVGVSGAVTINVLPGSGPYNAGFTFDNIPNANATNRVTFNGNGNTITGSLSPLVTFNNASFITLDSFSIVGAAGYAGFGVYFSNQSRNIVLNKNVIDVGTTSTSTTNAGIVASGSSSGATTTGNNARYLTITNNVVVGGYFSLILTGNASYLDNFGHIISNNTFRDFYLYGTYLLNADTTLLSNNSITRNTRSTISTFYGIFLSTARNIKVRNNRVFNSGVGSYTAYPIYVSTSVNSVGFETEFTNNLVYNINTTGALYGYYLLGTRDGMKFYHNTIDLNLNSSTGLVRAIWISTAPNNHDFKNNIISVSGNGSGTKHLIYITTGSPSVASNYNVLHMGAIGGVNHIGFLTTDQTSLAAWNTASLLDSNSVTFDPVFTSPASGNHTPLSVNIDNIGKPTGIVSDILGNTRSLTTPDAGAYEFTGLSGDMSVTNGSYKRSSLCYSNADSVFIRVRNLIGTTVNFGFNPLTVKWVSTGPINSNGLITLTSGSLSPNADTTVWANSVNMSLPGTYNLTVFIEPNTVNTSRLNDTLFNVASLIVRPILSVIQRNFTVTGPNDTVLAQANSPIFPGGSIFFSEVCHWRGATGAAPVNGWPAYLIADDYVEISGVQNTDLSGYILEEWTGTTLQHSFTFPTGSLFSPNGTMIVATGQLGASVPSPSNFYYHSGNTVTHSSTGDLRGYVIKSPGGGSVIDAVTYGAYVFPPASNVTVSDWSGSTPALSSAGNRLTSADNNTGSNWIVESATGRQDPNILNPNVPVPSPTTLTGFAWNYLGNPISTTPRTKLGPWTTPGVYVYVATYTNACGTFYDTVFVTAAATVPVTLSTFMGKANYKNADLIWQTASEKNAHLFEVHASLDGKMFKQISSIKANGNTNVTSTYNYTDVNALANNNKVYYKLKSVDVDGTYEWSNIVTVSANQAKNKIEIYPNPFNTNVTLSLVDNTPATIEVVSMQGVSVYNTTVNSNNLFVNINLTQLANGVYFIKVTQNGNTTLQKLVKQ